MSTTTMARARPPAPGLLPRPGRVWGTALRVVIALGILPVLLMWWKDTVAGAVSGPGGYLQAAGQVTGLIGAYLLLALVALMARIPWLENKVGSDVSAKIHRQLGEYTVILLCSHALLLILAYAVQQHDNVVHQTYVVEVSYPDVLMATAALGLFVMVGVLSARAVRRKVHYETWYLLHLYVYLAMGLAFAHEFAVGSDFSGSLRNRVLWSALHIGVAAAVIGFRVVLPAARSLRHQVRVEAVVREGPGVVSVHLRGRNLGALRAEAGQFLRWRFLARGMWWESHPYSLSAPPEGDRMRITVKDLGEGSALLARLRPGTRVWFEGPYGAFTADRRRGRSLLIAAGAGITPVRALYESLPGTGADVILLYRASAPGDLVLWDELEAIARRRGFGLYPLVGRRALHGEPLQARHLRRLVPDLADRDVFLCGPPGMTESTVKELRRAGVPRGRVHVESYDF